MSSDFEDYNEEDYCPLCIEEMDISDKKFFPCPCGYQICQFCYNNIRSNPDLNQRCPACRRKYDDESVRYVELTAEEIKAENNRKANKDKTKKQKEKERKEQEIASRKHLAGVRVIQKNLVYIVGLNPTVSHDELQSVLRSDRYFGQFGKIMKVVVNKRNQNANSVGNSGYGIYITFLKKEDADKCIREVDGSLMDGKVIRAAYGTTKYCSSYLRGLTCPNPNCMFLHEPGEEADSYKQEHSHQPEAHRHHEGGIIRYGINNATGTSANNSHSKNGSQDDIHEQTHNLKPALPATASWAKGNKSSTNLTTEALGNSANSINSITTASKSKTVISNTSAFPTLAEIALQRSSSNTNIVHTAHKEKKKDKHNKDKFKENVDELIIDESHSTKFMIKTLDFLKTDNNISNYRFKVDTFENKYDHNPDYYPPLFSFVSSNNLSGIPKDQANQFDYLNSGIELVNTILGRANPVDYFLHPKDSKPIQNPPANIPPQSSPQFINDTMVQNVPAAPGLFNPPPGLPIQQQPSPVPVAAVTGSNSHSSEILNHLLNGKKVSA